MARKMSSHVMSASAIALILVGCTVRSSPGLNKTQLAQKSVGPQGGTVTTDDGVTIMIPPGALDSNVTIIVSRIDDQSPPPTLTSLGNTYQFEPEGLLFQQPITVTLPIASGRTMNVESGGGPVLLRAPAGSNQWVALGGGGSTGTSVSGLSNEFSWWQPAWAPPCGGPSSGAKDASASGGSTGTDDASIQPPPPPTSDAGADATAVDAGVGAKSFAPDDFGMADTPICFGASSGSSGTGGSSGAAVDAGFASDGGDMGGPVMEAGTAPDAGTGACNPTGLPPACVSCVTQLCSKDMTAGCPALYACAQANCAAACSGGGSDAGAMMDAAPPPPPPPPDAAPPPQCTFNPPDAGAGTDGSLGSCDMSGYYNGQPRDATCTNGFCTCSGPGYATQFAVKSTCPDPTTWQQYCCH